MAHGEAIVDEDLWRRAGNGDNVGVVARPVPPGTVKKAAIAVIVGLMGSVMLAFLLEYVARASSGRRHGQRAGSSGHGVGLRPARAKSRCSGSQVMEPERIMSRLIDND